MQRLRVMSVAPGSTAERIGIRVDDRLLACNGIALESLEVLGKTLDALNGAPCELSILRDGIPLSMQLRAGPLGVTLVAIDVTTELSAAEITAREQAHAAELAAREREMLITTASFIDGWRTVKTIEVITAECVFGMNIFRDIFADVRDFFGGRSTATQRVLRDARKVALNELRREAAELGANAVIGVRLDYSEFSGGGKSMLFLVASGTAVVVEPSSPAVTRDRS